MSAPLTILHLTHEGHGAGSSISIALLARAQLRAGHQVMVGCPGGTWLEGLLRGSGVVTTEIPFDSVRHAAEDIERLTVLAGVDVVNAHGSLDRAATRRLRLRGRLRPALVMTRRSMPMSTLASAVLSGLAADRVIAVSRPVAAALRRKGTPPWKVRVVHNAVDLARLDRPVTEDQRAGAWDLIERRLASCALELNPGGWLTPFGPMIGVVSRRKDHDVLMRAMARVRTPATLCIIGLLPDDSLYRLPADSPHRCAFIAFQNNPRPFYDFFDVVVLPTRHEGLSQSLLEAMALGKPVVTTSGGGNVDLIEADTHGLLVPSRDPAALGDAIQRLLEDRALRTRLGDAGRLRVRAEFTIERTAAATERVYREALARR